MAQAPLVVTTADFGRMLRKGEEFAYLQFDGSGYIMLFDAACNVRITASPTAYYSQGAGIGYAHPN
jgi:hypothetical protein